MKFKLTFIAMAFSASTAFGTTLQVNTGFGFADDDLTDSTAGSLVGFGFAAFGTYGGGAITDAASLASQFTIGNFDDSDVPGTDLGLTTTDIASYTETFGQTAEGFSTAEFTKASTTGVTGQKVAVVIWKGGSDISTATEAVVFELDAVYESSATPVTLNYLNETGTLVYGTTKTQTAILTAVPEPSSTALLGLGGVALLLRRRR